MDDWERAGASAVLTAVEMLTDDEEPSPDDAWQRILEASDGNSQG